jgi:hypothetical protein
MGLRSWLLEDKNDKKDTSKKRIAYRIYSEILGSYLWIVETDQDLHTLKSRGISEPIYAGDEIQKLQGLSKDSLKELHKVKEIFQDSKIEEIIPKKGD